VNDLLDAARSEDQESSEERYQSLKDEQTEVETSEDRYEQLQEEAKRELVKNTAETKDDGNRGSESRNDEGYILH